MKKAHQNYLEQLPYLENVYPEINGYDFYLDIFPDNEWAGDLHNDFSKPNAIYLYKDSRDINTQRRLRRRIMLQDTWAEDYREFVECNAMTLCSGLSYRSKSNKLNACAAYACIDYRLRWSRRM